MKFKMSEEYRKQLNQLYLYMVRTQGMIEALQGVKADSHKAMIIILERHCPDVDLGNAKLIDYIISENCFYIEPAEDEDAE